MTIPRLYDRQNRFLNIKYQCWQCSFARGQKKPIPYMFFMERINIIACVAYTGHTFSEKPVTLNNVVIPLYLVFLANNSILPKINKEIGVRQCIVTRRIY